MEIRLATEQDIETLIRLRMEFLADGKQESGGEDPATLASRLRKYFTATLSSGQFIAVLAEEEGNVASCAYLSVYCRYSRRVEDIRPCGMIYNVYTPPAFRRRGLATKVLEALMRQAEELGLESLELLASEAGKPLYEKLGFREPSHTYMVKRMK